MACACVAIGRLRVGRDIHGLWAIGPGDSMGVGPVVLTATSESGATLIQYVLHVVPANGGGVDRYVRDICSLRSNDCILHVVDGQVVLEAGADADLIPIDTAQFDSVAFVRAFGRPALLHVHSVLPSVRAVVVRLCAMLGIDYALTLHDIDFAAAADDIPADERQSRHEFVRRAAVRTVPSRFVADLLSSAVGRDLTFELIPNGVDCKAEGVVRDFAVPDDMPFQIAVVGALGPHKGLNFLLDVVALLPKGVRAVIFGYADGHLLPGWLVEGQLWVHGAFEPETLPALARVYGCRLALFPNRQPESYCYALSDAWCSGLPALGPAAGAIGERIAETGAGWTYDSDSVATDVAAMISSCLREMQTPANAVSLARGRLVSRYRMVAALNQQYQKMNLGDPIAPDLSALQPLASAQLNGKFFRDELRRLAGDLEFARIQGANNEAALRALSSQYEGRGEWIAKLEAHLDRAQAEIVRLETARLAEREEYVQQAEKLARDVEDTMTAARRLEHALRRHELALAVLPPFVRRIMLKRADKLIGRENKS